MSDKLKICFVVGTRPNFVKAAPVIKTFKKSKRYNCTLLNTNQHYDSNLSDIFFKQLNIDKPDFEIKFDKNRNQETQIQWLIYQSQLILNKHKPDWVFIFGDVNSSLACTISAKNLNIKIAHVESGLRSNDLNMPEEINRIIIDKLSNILFVTEKSGVDNLLKEGIDNKKIHFVGNTMIDSLIHIIESESFRNYDVDINDDYIIVTLHRPSNVNNYNKLKKIIDQISIWNKNIKIIWPVHPRINLKRLKFNKNWIIINPLSYFNFIKMLKKSKGIFTDSGGIQEESTFLNIPCFTIRDSTERPITCEIGTNFLVSKKKINAKNIWNYKKNRIKIPKLWDGKSSFRILDTFIKKE